MFKRREKLYFEIKLENVYFVGYVILLCILSILCYFVTLYGKRMGIETITLYLNYYVNEPKTKIPILSCIFGFIDVNLSFNC